MKTTLIIVLCSTTIFISGCATSYSHDTAWEYKVVSGQFDGPLAATINKAADDGWVLVSSSSKTPDYGYAVMKRAKK